jgi:hypothetical protein
MTTHICNRSIVLMSCSDPDILTAEDNVRHKLSIFIFTVIIAVASTAGAQQATAGSGEQFLGTWTGTLDGGAAAARLQLTLEQRSDGATVASVSVSGDPTYKASFAELSFNGATMSGKYDFPPQPETEVLFVASFDGNVGTGTWSLREKASGFEVVSGHVKVTRN